MLHKKLNKEMDTADVKQRYSIRKFSVGAASVLIGLSFMGVMQGPTKVQAATGDDENRKNKEAEPVDQSTKNINVVESDQSETQASTNS